MMLQQETPDDYIVATGQTYSVRQFLEMTFGLLDMDYTDFVEFDPKYTRPRRSTSSWATRARPRPSWAGSPRSTCPAWSA
jgi:GDPmannose 4,6-dehydratase